MGGELTGQYELIDAKDRKEAISKANAEVRILEAIGRKAEAQVCADGVLARKGERGGKAELLRALPGDIGAAHLYIPIPIPDYETGA
jgi:hypothetical protein